MQSVDLLTFKIGSGNWDPDTNSVGFRGTGVHGLVDFLVTSEALAGFVDDPRGMLGRVEALKAFRDHETRLHTLAQREYRRHGPEEQPIMLWNAVVNP